jgi:hypothetical protein
MYIYKYIYIRFQYIICLWYNENYSSGRRRSTYSVRYTTEYVLRSACRRKRVFFYKKNLFFFAVFNHSYFPLPLWPCLKSRTKARGAPLDEGKGWLKFFNYYIIKKFKNLRYWTRFRQNLAKALPRRQFFFTKECRCSATYYFLVPLPLESLLKLRQRKDEDSKKKQGFRFAA